MTEPATALRWRVTRITLAVCAVLAAACAVTAVLDVRWAGLLPGLQPLESRHHESSRHQTPRAGAPKAAASQPSITAAAQVLAAVAIRYKAPVVLGQADGAPDAAIVLLHGLGGSPADITPLGRQLLQQPGMQRVRLVVPEAPQRAVTINNGRVMNAWYDMWSFDPIDEDEDEAALKESARYVASLVADAQVVGVPPQRVAVVGFSQGGAIALLLLRAPELRCGAVVALSTYMPLRRQAPVVSKANKETPTLICHGDADPTVLYRDGVKAFKQLQGERAAVQLKTYERLPHAIHPDEVPLVANFIRQSILGD